MENKIQLITTYIGIQNEEERRQAIATYKKQGISNTSYDHEIQHNYSGDSILIQLDTNGNWESDLFAIEQ